MKKIISLSIIIKGIVSTMLLFLAAWFILPFFGGTINVGNLGGTCACVVGILLVLFWDKFMKKPVRKLFKGIYIGVFSFYCLCVLFAVFLTCCMIYHAGNYPDKPTTVVVLGCQVRGRTPSLMLKERLDVAYDYLAANPEAKCIVTGGQGANEIVSEGEVMAEYLENRGIDSDRIYAETASKDTYENINFAKAIADKEGLGNEVVIATDAFHQMRATMIAEKAGFTVNNISSQTMWYLLPTYWFREWLGICNYTLFENSGFNV